MKHQTLCQSYQRLVNSADPNDQEEWKGHV